MLFCLIESGYMDIVDRNHKLFGEKSAASPSERALCFLSDLMVWLTPRLPCFIQVPHLLANGFQKVGKPTYWQGGFLQVVSNHNSLPNASISNRFTSCIPCFGTRPMHPGCSCICHLIPLWKFGKVVNALPTTWMSGRVIAANFYILWFSMI